MPHDDFVLLSNELERDKTIDKLSKMHAFIVGNKWPLRVNSPPAFSPSSDWLADGDLCLLGNIVLTFIHTHISESFFYPLCSPQQRIHILFCFIYPQN